jgi:starvation-inducible DNA-binding protein
MKATTFHTRIDIALDVRDRMVGLLNQQLADTFDLYSQTKQAHWNVKGAAFFALHQLFDELAKELADYADSLAERAAALGGTALGTARMSARATRLPEWSGDSTGGLRCPELLAVRFAALAATTRAAIDSAAAAGDAVTADLFTEIARGLDKRLWFLEAHLQADPATVPGRRDLMLARGPSAVRVSPGENP